MKLLGQTFGGRRLNNTSNVCRTAFENLAPIGVQSREQTGQKVTHGVEKCIPINRSMLSTTTTLNGLL